MKFKISFNQFYYPSYYFHEKIRKMRRTILLYFLSNNFICEDITNYLVIIFFAVFIYKISYILLEVSEANIYRIFYLITRFDK